MSRLIFFKMPNCKACDKFEQNVWPSLITDPDFSEYSFVRYLFGDINNVKYRLHDHYNFVTEVPYFAIETSDGEIINLGSMRKDRTVNGLKKHIDNALQYKDSLQ